MEKAKKIHNALNMHVIRFRKIAKLISFDPKSDNETLETYLLTTMTTEMIVKNSIKGLSNLINGSGEKSYIALPNLGRKSQVQEESKKDESWRWRGRKVGNKGVRGKLRWVDKWGLKLGVPWTRRTRSQHHPSTSQARGNQNPKAKNRNIGISNGVRGPSTWPDLGRLMSEGNGREKISHCLRIARNGESLLGIVCDNAS